MTLHVRWLGTVPYREALDLQHAIHRRRSTDHLLLLEHPHVYTLGVRADMANVLVRPADVGADLVRADRGGDVTYHGPGQLTGYPILTVPGKRGGGMADTADYVHAVEQVLIDSLADLGLRGAGRLEGHPGVWVDPTGPRPRKIAAIGVRLSRSRSMHGFALNVDPDLTMFDHIVPCGIAGLGVTSLHAEGVDVPMRAVVDAVAGRAAARWGGGHAERADVAWRVRAQDVAAFTRTRIAATPVESPRLRRRLDEVGVQGGLAVRERKPEWLRAPMRLGPEYRRLRRTMRSLDLVTVCEEAGCPNISECWADGTATFMINGERCTRACGFCLVDTRQPLPVDAGEPERVADAVRRMSLRHAVVTAVARDDLADGGAAAFAATVRAIRRAVPACRVELLVPDCRGDAESLGVIFDAGPDVLNHNIETVARLQRAVRPSAGYARSLAVLARAKAAGLTSKSGLIVGMGETDDEVHGALVDLAAVGCDIVTIGQYLRPTAAHLPVHRWVAPAVFDDFRLAGRALGIGHVEASPLTRSSYHARQAAESTAGVTMRASGD